MTEFDPEKIFLLLQLMQEKLDRAIDGNKHLSDRMSREIEIAQGIHDVHDKSLASINYILKGNGEKGLIERQRDQEGELAALHKELETTRGDSRSLVRSILLGAVAIVIVLAVTSIAGGGQ